MLAELSVIDRFWVRLRWSLGDALALVRVWLIQAASTAQERSDASMHHRCLSLPLPLTLTSF